MNTNPKVSIIIPTYNRAHLIGATINSVQLQSFTDWECIIVDDGSTDSTPELISDLMKKDSRIKLLLNTRTKGAQGARNTGILNANGDFAIFFDSDNLMYSDFIEKVYSKIVTTQSDVCACFSTLMDCTTRKVSGKFEWICEGDIYHQMISGTVYVDYNSSIVRKELLYKIDLLDENCPSFQEWDTHLRLSKIAKYTTVQECLVDYFQGGSDTISNDNQRTIKGYLYILKKFKVEWLEINPDAYLSYGIIVHNLILKQNDKDYIRKTIQELFKIMPQLGKALLLKKAKKLFKLFLPPIVFLIYKKLRK